MMDKIEETVQKMIDGKALSVLNYNIFLRINRKRCHFRNGCSNNSICISYELIFIKMIDGKIEPLSCVDGVLEREIGSPPRSVSCVRGDEMRTDQYNDGIGVWYIDTFEDIYFIIKDLINNSAILTDEKIPYLVKYEVGDKNTRSNMFWTELTCIVKFPSHNKYWVQYLFKGKNYKDKDVYFVYTLVDGMEEITEKRYNIFMKKDGKL